MTSEISKDLENINLNDYELLETEKDFVDLSVLSVAKIKESNKPIKFTMTYIKKNLEELCDIQFHYGLLFGGLGGILTHDQCFMRTLLWDSKLPAL